MKKNEIDFKPLYYKATLVIHKRLIDIRKYLEDYGNTDQLHEMLRQLQIDVISDACSSDEQFNEYIKKL